MAQSRKHRNGYWVLVLSPFTGEPARQRITDEDEVRVTDEGEVRVTDR